MTVREISWLLAIIPLILAARYLPALPIMAVASNVPIGSLEHRLQIAAMYLAWAGVAMAAIALSRIALLGGFRPTVAQLGGPILIALLATLTEFAQISWAFDTYGRFERDTFGPIRIVSDVGVVTACLVFAVLIAPRTARIVAGVAALAGSTVGVWASAAALSSTGDGMTRGLIALLVVVLLPTALSVGLLAFRAWTAPQPSRG